MPTIITKLVGECYDTMGNAAAHFGIPVATLRWAKRNGAPGFRGSRVYPTELLPWLEKHEAEAGDEGKEILQCRLLRIKIKREQFDFDVEREVFVRKADVDQWLTAKIEKFKAVLRRRLKNDLPPKLEGLRAAEIAEKMDGVISDAIGALRDEV